jgi:hypothetical protein
VHYLANTSSYFILYLTCGKIMWISRHEFSTCARYESINYGLCWRIHAPCGIRTRSPSKLAAAGPCLGYRAATGIGADSSDPTKSNITEDLVFFQRCYSTFRSCWMLRWMLYIHHAKQRNNSEDVNVRLIRSKHLQVTGKWNMLLMCRELTVNLSLIY